MAIDTHPARAIAGWMAKAELYWLAGRAAQSEIVIEIGAWLGRSTRVLGDHCPGLVLTVDPWNGYTNEDGTLAEWMLKGKTWDEAYAQFQANVADLIASGRVIPIRKTSDDAIGSVRYRLRGRRADLVFLDGDHHYEQVLKDIESYRKFVKPGGILAGHDWGRPVDWPGVERAVRATFAEINVFKTIWWVTL